MRCGLLGLCPPYRATQFRHAVRLCLCPVDFWRYREFAAVIDEYRGESPILDLASPRLLGVILARRANATILATDVAPAVGSEIGAYARAAGRGRLTGYLSDARAMPLSSNAIPFAYAVSVLEHIADDGDTRAIVETARVLAPGGRVVLTVPMAARHQDIWLDKDPYGRQPSRADGKVFFSRLYDRQTLGDRLVAPSGLRVKACQVYADTPPGWYDDVYAPRVARPLTCRAIATKLFDMRSARRHIFALPQGEPIAGRSVACLTLEKSG